LPYWILPSLLLGLAYAHAVELQHQCLHNTAYRSRFWGRVVGVLLGLPSLVSFSDYQNSHLKHHRLLGTPEDKEFFNYAYQKLNSIPTLVAHLWMVRHHRDVVGYISKSAVGKLVRKEQATLQMAKRIRFEYQLMAVFLVAMAVLTIVFQTTLFLKLWLVPFLIAIPTHALIELPEHIGCDTTDPERAGQHADDQDEQAGGVVREREQLSRGASLAAGCSERQVSGVAHVCVVTHDLCRCWLQIILQPVLPEPAEQQSAPGVGTADERS
jgi:fatty acid desaturase